MALYDDLVVKNRPAAAPATTYGTNDLSETNILPWQRNLDSDTQGLLSDRMNTANNVHALDDTEGASKYGSDFAKGHMPTTLQGGMGMSPNFTSALATRASNQAGESLTRMKMQSDLDAPSRTGNALANAGTQLRGAEQLKLHNFQQQVQYQDKVNAYNRAIDAERANILGSILGGVGGIAGKIIEGKMRGGSKGGDDEEDMGDVNNQGDPFAGGNGGSAGTSQYGSGPTDNSHGYGGIPGSQEISKPGTPPGLAGQANGGPTSIYGNLENIG